MEWIDEFGITLSVDKSGHEHKGKGKDGGQFTSKDAVSETKVSRKALTEDSLIEHYQDWIDATAVDVLEKIEDYCGDGYKGTNGLLRELEIYKKFYSSHPEQLEEKWETIRAMDALIESSPPLKEDTILHRIVDGDFVSILKPEVVFQDKGFVSTSFAGMQAYTTSGEHATATIEINVPKGTRALPATLMQRKMYPDDFIEEEDELILPRGSSFRVISRTKVSKRNYKIVVELLA